MPGSVHVGFMVDRVAVGQVFLQLLRFSPVSIIPMYSYFTWVMNIRPFGGCSSET
jgi:hypothetical protein